MWPVEESRAPTPEERAALEAALRDLDDLRAKVERVARRAYAALVPFLEVRTDLNDRWTRFCDEPADDSAVVLRPEHFDVAIEDEFEALWPLGYKVHGAAFRIQCHLAPVSRVFAGLHDPEWFRRAEDPEHVIPAAST